MLLSIRRLIAEEARFRHVLLVGSPRSSADFDQVRKAGCIEETITAVFDNTKGISSDHGEVIWQAWMLYGIVLCKDSIFAGKSIESWHVWIADNFAKFLILKHDDNDVLEVRDERSGRGGR